MKLFESLSSFLRFTLICAGSLFPGQMWKWDIGILIVCVLFSGNVESVIVLCSIRRKTVFAFWTLGRPVHLRQEYTQAWVLLFYYSFYITYQEARICIAYVIPTSLWGYGMVTYRLMGWWLAQDHPKCFCGNVRILNFCLHWIIRELVNSSVNEPKP